MARARGSANAGIVMPAAARRIHGYRSEVRGDLGDHATQGRIEAVRGGAPSHGTLRQTATRALLARHVTAEAGELDPAWLAVWRWLLRFKLLDSARRYRRPFRHRSGPQRDPLVGSRHESCGCGRWI